MNLNYCLNPYKGKAAFNKIDSNNTTNFILSTLPQKITNQSLQYKVKTLKNKIYCMSIDTQGFYSAPYFEIEQQQSGGRSYNPLHTDYLMDNRSHYIIPLTQKKSNTNSIKNQDDKSFTKNQLDLSEILPHPNKSTEKQPIAIKVYKSLLPQALNNKAKNGASNEITVYFFSSNKKIVFPKSQLSKKFAFSSETDKQPPLIKFLIPYMVKQYCKTFLSFEPLEVNDQNFQLKVTGVNSEDDSLIEPYSHDEQILWLFQCGNLILVRKQKDYERLKIWQKNVPGDTEIFQIITPFQKQVLEKAEKNKTLASLKQKLMSYSQFSNVVIVTYNTFTVCEFKKKISEIVLIDRILQVYRIESNVYEDVDISLPKQKMESSKQPTLYPKQSRFTDAQFEVSQNFYSGKLYIQILGTKIIQKYEGGIVSYITSNQRRVQRSVHTLIGISCENTTIKMKFLTKSGAEINQYDFQSKNQVQIFFKCILKLGRELKQNFEKISQ